MTTDVQGRALAVLNRVAQADWPDRLKLRKPFEKLLYSGSRTGFRMVSERAAKQSKMPRKVDPDGLFDLSLSDEQQMLVEMLEGFAADVLRPAAHDADARASLSLELLSQAQELGLTHYGVGEVHGGMAGERTTLTNALIAEALARGDMSLAAALLVPLSAANCIRRWASAEQQSRWLPAFVAEEAAPLIAIAVNEPQLLADPQRLSAKARKRGGHYLLSGEKCLVLRGVDAQKLIVAADSGDGPALFLVDARAKGVEVRSEPAMGLKAAGTARVRFKSVKVPTEHRLAAEHFDYTAFLDHAALAWCALAVGTAQAALDYVITYCNEREAFGEPISHRQGVAFMVSDIAIELDAMRLMVWRACALAERGQPFHREAYLARLLCAEKAMKIGTDAVQLLGGHGFTQEHPAERWYRDLRAVSLMAGGLHL
ncbi:acyl-CoA dehydrogenase family protein [Pseudomonas sp. ZM23]|uniref:Acyl-CoA dehydrogenase family protein n=1 Tax=Pseudomonas triclosanedens TaxID=2961893 RepID=A0ABY6ZX43_9PSED|nr:acyl-CoA dehydrogenase family protein [Pseudomonas triclosanedens]MCP8465109.1 acyl-CoA dehydrogenase family protein [Pseudomonas triclosanedens]MCP8470951.1 acyl-CoA dehydrogenase family protein [Pseudomonas triclosanedens]MCP8476409.1 acyl-CoA dehydrogenase family protein [Pseudomonas triclosanedens]WAI49132.1 acyl-CoA dehydrogenase family protein [Pseudomonas triclosanedens]